MIPDGSSVFIKFMLDWYIIRRFINDFMCSEDLFKPGIQNFDDGDVMVQNIYIYLGSSK
jgi:hypothetical protein